LRRCAVEAIGEVAEGFGQGAHGRDGLAADLGDDRVVDIGDGVTQFHLDEFDGLFDAVAYAARAGAWWGICAHDK